jgi:hypothetical protein
MTAQYFCSYDEDRLKIFRHTLKERVKANVENKKIDFMNILTSPFDSTLFTKRILSIGRKWRQLSPPANYSAAIPL